MFPSDFRPFKFSASPSFNFRIKRCRISRLLSFVFIFAGFLLQAEAQGCECTLFYSCDESNVDTQSQKCSSPEVCCREGSDALIGPTSTPKVDVRNPDTTVPPENCECRPATDCPAVSGAFQLDVRFGEKKGQKCSVENHVCCPVDNNGKGSVGGNGGGGGNGGEGGGANGGGGDFGGDEIVQECGVRGQVKQDTTFRITAPNSETAFGEFPWMMAVLTTKRNPDGSFTDNVFQCGASLITPNAVLTAAHCVHDLRPQDIKIRGGEWDTLTNNDTFLEPYPYQEVGVSQVLVHDKFHLPTVYNDIAILILKHDFPMRRHINLVCTPNSAYDYDPDSCLVTGWGKDQFGMYGQYQSRLRMLDLRLVQHDSCEQQLRQTRLGSRFRLHESFICAKGDQNKDACKGDGGGPLICRLKQDPSRYTQVGIVAWGIGCGGDVPGVYVDVLRFKAWILRNSDRHKLDTRFGSQG